MMYLVERLERGRKAECPGVVVHVLQGSMVADPAEQLAHTNIM